jgi:hypothetical protein
MSGYVASARIVRGAPRLARWASSADRSLDLAPAAAVDEPLIVEGDPSSAGGPGGFVERLEAFRDRWSQLTFFLFDPNSWR